MEMKENLALSQEIKEAWNALNIMVRDEIAVDVAKKCTTPLEQISKKMLKDKFQSVVERIREIEVERIRNVEVEVPAQGGYNCSIS